MSGGTPSPSPSPSFASTSSVHVGKEKVAGNSTEDRLEKIRRKREEQRKKREEQIKKRDSSTRRLGENKILCMKNEITKLNQSGIFLT